MTPIFNMNTVDGIILYLTIGAIFGFIVTFTWSKLPKEYKRPSQTLDEFGWVEHLMLILLWPLGMLFIGIGMVKGAINEFKNK